MKARAYIETSMVSYLTARPSRDVVAAAHQQISLIVNSAILSRIALICEPFGLVLPYICTPEELIGES